jgi:aminopeptidase N
MLIKPRDDRFADQIAEFTHKSADYFSRLLYPFPFDRLSVISAPFGRGLLGVAYPGAMMLTEHAFAGGIGGDYDRDSYRLLVVAHEAAHTYFPFQTSGRGIAERWLSEGFAEYLGLMTVEALMGRQAFRRELDDNRRWYAGAVGRDRAIGSYTVINRGPEWPAVIYAKGSFVLHMLRFVVGSETFNKILQTFATRFRSESVRVDDFVQVSSEVAGRDLRWFFQEWIHELVLPDYTIAEAASTSAEGGFRTTARVRNLGTGIMPVEILFEMDGGERVTQRVEIGSRAEVTATVTTPRPVRRVEADPEKWILQVTYNNDSAAVR